MTAPKSKATADPVAVDTVADEIVATAKAGGVEAGKAAFVDAATAILTQTPVPSSTEKAKTIADLGGAQVPYCDVCGSGTKEAKTGDVVHQPTCSVEMTPEQIKAMDRGAMYDAAKAEAQALKTAAAAGRPLPETPVLDYMNSVDASTRRRDSARANGHTASTSSSTGGARVKMTDDEIAKVCKPIIDGGVTNRNAVIKAFREAGHSASWQRVFPIIEPMIEKAPKTAPAKKAPAVKKGSAKLSDSPEALAERTDTLVKSVAKAAAKKTTAKPTEAADVPDGTPGPPLLASLMNPIASKPKATAKKATPSASEMGAAASAQKRLASRRETTKASVKAPAGK